MIKGILIAAVTAVVGFVAGAWWHAELSQQAPSGPAVAPIFEPVACPACPSCPPCEAPAAAVAGAVAAPACAPLQLSLETSRAEATQLRTELQRREEGRAHREGTPIHPATRKNEVRHQPQVLRTVVTEAFQEAKVPGRVDGLDCSEWPCIVYGRIRGTEDEMEKLEGAKALAGYEKDVLNVLLWVVTDEAATEAALPILPGRPEQTLFAFAWYPRGLERTVSENVERRVRSRTADLWNTMSPSDETGR